MCFDGEDPALIRITYMYGAGSKLTCMESQWGQNSNIATM